MAQAQGDAQRFRSVLTEYQRAPQVTRDRMYLDTMQQIYANVTKVLVDSRQGSNLLYLPLDRIMQQVAQGGAAAEPAPTAPPSGAPNGTLVPGDVRARDNLRKEVAALAVAGAAKVLGREVDAKAHAALLEDLAAELEKGAQARG